MSPVAQRAAAGCSRLASALLSDGRARITGQNRSTQRHRGRRLDRGDALRRRLRKVSAEHRRWGYRRA